ncbi:MAG: hypothetical protein BVN31_09405 [Proteobacteria bacterium ST_bin15]|nr:MAG: hypothetical protein BVN31_09405 [Proteobacteria bacterium ST_bin15]
MAVHGYQRWVATVLTVMFLPLMGLSAAGQNIKVPGVNGHTVKTVIHAKGAFRQVSAGAWMEDPDLGTVTAFVEQSRDDTSVTLLDPGRKAQLRIDLKQMKLLFARSGGSFRPLYSIASASATATPVRTVEQRCQDAVQGKIAWNAQGPAEWPQSELKHLCSDAVLPASAIECFETQVQSHGDRQRAIKTCADHRHEVQVLYVVPNGQTPRPDAVKVLHAAMRVVQRHYFQQLGVSFRLKQALVAIVHADETAEQIKADLHAHAARLASNAFREDFMHKENVIVAVYEGVVTGTAHGGGNVASIPGDFWAPVYEMFVKAPDDLPKVRLLHGWSHELGHAFGLTHTETTRDCLKPLGVDMGQLPSLIMQRKETLPTVYDYPFTEQEKRLLLDEHYFPFCHPLAAARPHAHWHLRHTLPQ